MFTRVLRIWLTHSLAFLAGLVVSGVVAVGLWFLIPAQGSNALLLGSGLGVSIISVGTGYAVYLSLISALLGVVPGWGFYLGGPLVVLASMGLVFVAVFYGVLSIGNGSLMGYGLLYLIGGIALHLFVARQADAADSDPEDGA